MHIVSTLKNLSMKIMQIGLVLERVQFVQKNYANQPSIRNLNLPGKIMHMHLVSTLENLSRKIMQIGLVLERV